jgi:hypothetical protein
VEKFATKMMQIVGHIERQGASLFNLIHK